VANARSRPAAPPVQGSRMRALTVAGCTSLSAITLLALIAPNRTTTWLHAWAGTVGIGLAAGLITLWLGRPRRPRSRLLDLLTGLAAVKLVAEIVRDLHRAL
jgi:hypothetical protein